MSATAASIYALAVAAIVVVVSIRWRSKKLWRVLGSRTEINVEHAISEHYGPEPVDVPCAVELWGAIASCYSVPPGKLRLEDRFAHELDTRRVFTVDDENSSINLVIAKAIAARGADIDASQLFTIDDCIRALCRPT